MNNSPNLHALILAEKVAADTGVTPTQFVCLSLEDKAPPVLPFNGDLYVTQADLYLWKSRLREASLGLKARVLKAGGRRDGR